MITPALLRLLLIEDSINDTFLMIRELERTGLKVEFERVETAAYLREALETKEWDLIICDDNLRDFDWAQALALYRAKGLDAPFIIVSGILGEDRAIEIIKAGAQEYISKDNLGRLAPAVLRELRSAQERRLLRQSGVVSEAARELAGEVMPEMLAKGGTTAPDRTLKPAA